MKIRYISTDEEIKVLFVFLIQMFAESRRAPGDPNEAFREVYALCKEGMACVVEADDGAWIGSLGLFKSPFWYNSKAFLFCDRWFYTIPAWRYHREPFRLMLAEARALVDYSGIPALITVFNPRRFARRNMTRTGEHLWVMPAGTEIMIEPKGAEDEREQDEHQHVEYLDELS